VSFFDDLMKSAFNSVAFFWLGGHPFFIGISTAVITVFFR